jgi:hypothetical protein
LKNRPHDIENPAALNLGGGFRAVSRIDISSIFRYLPITCGESPAVEAGLNSRQLKKIIDRREAPSRSGWTGGELHFHDFYSCFRIVKRMRY